MWAPRFSSAALLALLASVGLAEAGLRSIGHSRDFGTRGAGRALAGATYTDAALADEVKGLPGLDGKNVSFRQFAGYLPISDAKQIFYWYIESQSNPDTDPLVFWTNGGPGCSGLIGLLTEHGPFRPTKGGKSLTLNPYSWNRQANMLYVESPVSVGFSTSSDGKLSLNDSSIANDNYALLQTFLGRFPHLKERELYLSGESYAGHYVPTLAAVVVAKNKAGANPRLNLKGLMIGNPLTDPVENVLGSFATFHEKGLIPEDLFKPWAEKCANDSVTFETFRIWYCDQTMNNMYNHVGDRDPYGLSYPRCRSNSYRRSFELGSMPFAQASRSASQWAQHASFASTANSTQGGDNSSSSSFEPCRDNFLTDYLNRDDVKKVIHANPEVTWGECSDTVGSSYNRDDKMAYMQPIYNDLMKNNPEVRILIFSGDDDSVCSTAGTKYWLSKTGWASTSDAKTWSVAGGNQAPAGTIQRYGKSFAFAVVNGAGHEVPSYKPEASLALFNSFLNDRLKDGEMALTGI